MSLSLPFQEEISFIFVNNRTGFKFVVRLNPEFNWFDKLEGNIYTQIDNVHRCFRDILLREDSKARDCLEANNWTDIFIKCPFHYDIEKDISCDRPHLTVVVNGDLNAYHFYSTKNCRAFTNITRIEVVNIDWSFENPKHGRADINEFFPLKPVVPVHRYDYNPYA